MWVCGCVWGCGCVRVDGGGGLVRAGTKSGRRQRHSTASRSAHRRACGHAARLVKRLRALATAESFNTDCFRVDPCRPGGVAVCSFADFGSPPFALGLAERFSTLPLPPLAALPTPTAAAVAIAAGAAPPPLRPPPPTPALLLGGTGWTSRESFPRSFVSTMIGGAPDSASSRFAS